MTAAPERAIYIDTFSANIQRIDTFSKQHRSMNESLTRTHPFASQQPRAARGVRLEDEIGNRLRNTGGSRITFHFCYGRFIPKFQVIAHTHQNS